MSSLSMINIPFFIFSINLKLKLPPCILIFVNFFITSVKSFVENKGNEYLEEIFYEDFILNFMNDLNFIKIIIDFSNQYI
jgi:hypothetical protein